MPLKLSLTAQGLVLVSIPLCFEIGFVALLTHLQAESEAEVARTLKAHQLSDTINKLNADLYQGVELIGLVNKQQWLTDGFTDRRYKGICNSIRRDYQELTRLTADKPALNETVKQQTRTIDKIETMVDSVVADINAHRIAKVLKYQHEGEDRLRALFRGMMFQELSLVAGHEREFAEASPERQMAIRSKITSCALMVVGLNVAFSILIAMFLIKQIMVRINVIIENTKRLASDTPLHAPMTDSDEIAQLDHAFHKMADEIHQSAEMRREMVSMITHDLRSPLTSMEGTLELFELGRLGNLNERGQQMIKLIKRNGFRMMSLINDLLDIEKMRSGMMSIEKEKVCLAEVFEEVKLNLADWLEEKGIQLIVDDTDLVIEADRDKLARVLFNLVSNAIKFSNKGDTIKLAAEENESAIEVTVQDHGPGIPKEMLEQIFERFRQTAAGEKSAGSSGLGLSICREIVRLHGGNIWATSVEGSGSTFHFTLPTHL